MTIDLDRFQAKEPYPELRNVRPDKRLAAHLLEGYSGETSELTTILQYAYHSLMCKKRYAEVSETIRGIFHVETLHLEFLGDCICRLGAPVQYQLALREKKLFWQASVVEYADTPAKMILADIRGEKEAAAFYEQAAETAKNQPPIAAMLSRLAADERLHIQIFTDLYNRYFR